MKKRIISAVSVASFVMAFGVQAQSFGQNEIGLIGQDTGADSEDVTEFGVMYSNSNIYTEDSGYIYKNHAEWVNGDEKGVDSTSYDVGLSTGYRFDVNQDVAFDLIGGLGYKNWELEGNDFTDTADSIYLRYGTAMQFDVNRDNVLRLEVGSRYTISGDYEEENTQETTSESLENRDNFYAEASWMTQATGVQMRFSVFHEKKEYEGDVNDEFGIDANTTGLKVSALL